MSGKDYPKRSLSSDNYRTDKWILEIFDGWFDPCPFNPEWVEDGLSIDWPDRTFINPPYSKPLPWIKKAIATNKIYNHSIALLLKHDSSTEWFRLLHAAGAHFLLVNGRLKHQTSNGAAFPSVIAFLH